MAFCMRLFCVYLLHVFSLKHFGFPHEICTQDNLVVSHKSRILTSIATCVPFPIYFCNFTRTSMSTLATAEFFSQLSTHRHHRLSYNVKRLQIVRETEFDGTLCLKASALKMKSLCTLGDQKYYNRTCCYVFSGTMHGSHPFC